MTTELKKEPRRVPRFQIEPPTVKCYRTRMLAFLRTPIPVRLLDISSIGLRLSSSEPVREGEKMMGTLSLQETRETLEFSGVVIWTQERLGSITFGLEFGMSGDQVAAKIEALRKIISSERYQNKRGS